LKLLAGETMKKGGEKLCKRGQHNQVQGEQFKDMGRSSREISEEMLP